MVEIGGEYCGVVTTDVGAEVGVGSVAMAVLVRLYQVEGLCGAGTEAIRKGEERWGGDAREDWPVSGENKGVDVGGVVSCESVAAY